MREKRPRINKRAARLFGTNLCRPIFIEVHKLPPFKGIPRFKEQFTADGEIPLIGVSL